MTLNRELKAVFESSSDGIWVCDGSGKVISINSASERLNGVSARDIVGKHVSYIMGEGLFDRSVTLEVLETLRAGQHNPDYPQDVKIAPRYRHTRLRCGG